MANQYAIALHKLKIKDVTILGNSKINAKKLSEKYNFNYMYGGFEKTLSKIPQKDLVIVCTPLELLVSATILSLDNNKNILIEKPGSLYSQQLIQLEELIANKNVKIGYNRLQYPSFYQLISYIQNNKEKITSCHIRFPEIIDRIDFSKYKKDVYQRWGISNSLHVISMMTRLIGFPKKITSVKTGKFSWHNSGSIFIGSGISEQNIPFSYHSDWESPGRWSVEIMTNKNQYRLLPLEQLSIFDGSNFKWRNLPHKEFFKNTKPGICEEIIIMLNHNQQMLQNLCSLREGISLIQLAEKIFGYKNS